MSLTTRTTCRICGSPELTPVLSLGEQYIAAAFADPDGEAPISRRVPLELMRCDMTRNQDGCGLVQLRHTVPDAILYRCHRHRRGINRTTAHNLHQLATQAEEMVVLHPGDVVVDIGCNDGTLLDGYRAANLRYLGFDPSEVSRDAVAKGYEVVRSAYSYGQLRELCRDRKARVITSGAAFESLEDPRAFVAELARGLADDGVWVTEVHYLPAMLDLHQFDAIVHEHLEFYSLAVIERLLDQAGLRVVRARLNDANGGSLRLFIRHSARCVPTKVESERLELLRVREFELALDAPGPYERFAADAELIRDELARTCRQLVAAGKTIHVYGASTRGNAMLQYVGIDRTLVSHAADRNPSKHGSLTIGTGIPIVSEEHSRAMHPDYYLVLPWQFLDEFLDREQEFLDRGGQFIVAIPRVTILPGRVPQALAA